MVELCTPVFRPEGPASVLPVVQGKIGRPFHATKQADLYGCLVGRQALKGALRGK